MKELATRCFVTTTASWQRFVREQGATLPPDFVDVALSLEPFFARLFDAAGISR